MTTSTCLHSGATTSSPLLPSKYICLPLCGLIFAVSSQLHAEAVLYQDDFERSLTPPYTVIFGTPELSSNGNSNALAFNSTLANGTEFYYDQIGYPINRGLEPLAPVPESPYKEHQFGDGPIHLTTDVVTTGLAFNEFYADIDPRERNSFSLLFGNTYGVRVVRFMAEGVIMYYDFENSATPTPIGAYSDGTPVRVEMFHNSDEGRFDVFLNSAPAYSGMLKDRESVGTIRMSHGRTSAIFPPPEAEVLQASTTHVDNIQITGAASIVFRERVDEDAGFYAGTNKDDVPGWDHVALRFGNTMYESNVSQAGAWWDPLRNQYVVLADTPGGGVQHGHTFGSFKHDSNDLFNSPVLADGIDEIEMPSELAFAMVERIKTREGFTFTRPDFRTLGQFIVATHPSTQKGEIGNSVTCVGLLEWAAEEAGYNGGEGFIPDSDEFLNLPAFLGGQQVPILSPQVMHWYLTEGIGLKSNVMRGLVDPADFILTDPIGRRLGYTAETGLLNEIPGGYYTGDGDFEQFLVTDPMPGVYTLDLFGLDADEMWAAFGDRVSGNLFNGQLGLGGRATITYVVVPEPTLGLPMTVAAIVALWRRLSRRGPLST